MRSFQNLVAKISGRGHRLSRASRRDRPTSSRDYLRDFVYGAIDGVVTTFAVVAGVAGADLEAKIVLILGTANLLADGFSMSVSNFLGSRAALQQAKRRRREQREQIRSDPGLARRRAVDALSERGFTGGDLASAEVLMVADEHRWAALLSDGSLGRTGGGPNPLVAAAATLVAFVSLGSLPLLPFVYDLVVAGDLADPFAWAAAMAAIAFFIVGAMKSRFVDQRWHSSGAETLLVGGLAAGLAFGVGTALAGVGG